ncbi:MAG: pseudouridine synthase, partial [Bacteroidota bacterium]
MPYLFQIYKPHGMLSQFTASIPGKRTLGELQEFPPQVYPIGRLDEDSEGLLLLSDDKSLNQKLLGQGIEKEYFVQVEGSPTNEDLDPIRQGVEIRVRKKLHHCLPANVRILQQAPIL